MRAVARWLALALVWLPSGTGAVAEIRAFDVRPDLPASAVRSGADFLTPESRSLQADGFANPGYLWVERGRELFEATSGRASCASCHGRHSERPMRGAATRYPRYDERAGSLLNLAARINRCRSVHQAQPGLAGDSEELLSLTAYVAYQSQGMPFDVSVSGAASPFFERGRAYFFRRRGQLNLACNQCHDDNWGRKLRGDTISQGHPNAWPAYRLEWQTFGSLHRRIRDCDAGVRAKPHPAGAGIYTSLELYLAWRARDLPIESPGIRR